MGIIVRRGTRTFCSMFFACRSLYPYRCWTVPVLDRSYFHSTLCRRHILPYLDDAGIPSISCKTSKRYPHSSRRINVSFLSHSLVGLYHMVWWSICCWMSSLLVSRVSCVVEIVFLRGQQFPFCDDCTDAFLAMPILLAPEQAP